METKQERIVQAAHGVAGLYRDLAAQMIDVAGLLDRAAALPSSELPVVDPSRLVHAMRAGMALEYLKKHGA